jgi:hypothetical protein
VKTPALAVLAVAGLAGLSPARLATAADGALKVEFPMRRTACPGQGQ